MNKFFDHLNKCGLIHVEQAWEGFEIVLGWESRNKYRILDENMRPLAFAAEQSTGFGGAVLRQVLGHLRSFNVSIFDENRQKIYELAFPFRWFFKTLILRDAQGEIIGSLEQRFAFFCRKFDVLGPHQCVIARIDSSFFKFWTFEFKYRGRSLGKVQKKWSGVFGELFTDKDNFVVSFEENVPLETRALMLATSLMVDIVYFENKGKQGSVFNKVFD